MKNAIKRVHENSFGLYGTRKVWHQLRREGIAVAKCTVERLMRAMGLAGVRRGKTTITTVSNPKAPCPLDKVNREFRVSRPNALWVVDFTYVHSWTEPRRVFWRPFRLSHAAIAGSFSMA